MENASLHSITPLIDERPVDLPTAVTRALLVVGPSLDLCFSQGSCFRVTACAELDVILQMNVVLDCDVVFRLRPLRAARFLFSACFGFA